MRHSFPLHRAIGAPEPRRRFTLSGRQFFQHRPSGVRELRQRVRPDGRLFFLHRKAGARELPQAGSPLTGGEFFAGPQRGIRRLRTAGTSRRPPRGAKRKDNLRFSFLFELLPFPCFLIWRKFPICDRFETGERQSGYRCVGFVKYSQFTDSVLLHMWVYLRRRDIPVSRNSLARYDRQHLRR